VDGSESDDSEFEEIMERLFKERIPSHAITNYYELTVQGSTKIEFVRHFRITPQLFWNLSKRYENTAAYQRMLKFNPKRTLPADKIIAVFLWFAAHEGCCYRDLCDHFHVSLSTVHWCIIRSVAFVSNMSAEVIRWPSPTKMQEEAAFREGRRRIPGIFGRLYALSSRSSFQENYAGYCIFVNELYFEITGCVDGTKIEIDPPQNKDDYIDRKGSEFF